MSDPDIPHYIKMVMKTLLSAVPGTLGGSLAGYYFARRMEGARRKDRLKEDHLRELKQDLLQILRTRLAEFYSPICNGQSGSVERLTDQVRKKPVSITDELYVRTDFVLSIRPIRAESSHVTEIFEGRPRVMSL